MHISYTDYLIKIHSVTFVVHLPPPRLLPPFVRHLVSFKAAIIFKKVRISWSDRDESGRGQVLAEVSPRAIKKQVGCDILIISDNISLVANSKHWQFINLFFSLACFQVKKYISDSRILHWDFDYIFTNDVVRS